MKNKKELPKHLVYLIDLLFLTAFVLFAVLREEEGGHWVVDYTHFVRLVPFFVVYLLLELWLFPQYIKTKKMGRYAFYSVLMVLGVSLLWSLIYHPQNIYEDNLESQTLVREIVLSEDTIDAKMNHWLMVDSLSAEQLADSCRAFCSQNVDSAKGRTMPPPPPHHPRFAVIFLFSLGVFAFFTTIHFLFRFVETEILRQEAERMRIEAELVQLRYQLNPHFLMNTLNNIHALIDIDVESAQESVVLLSKMMRYMLYEANKEFVELSKEVDFLHHYFMLMRKRYIDSVEIVVDIPDALPHAMIPPAILVNLAENSFKHGISYQKNSFIHFSMEVLEKYICCHIVNSKGAASMSVDSGVGIENIRKRLDILYPGQYVYAIRENEAEYSVELKIPFHYEVSGH